MKIEKLLNDMRMNKEAWSEDLGNKGGTEVEHDCIQDFIDAGKLDKLSETLHIDSDIILQLVKRYSQYLKLPKKNWIKYTPRKEVATIHVPEEEEHVVEEKETPYEPPLPFPEAKRIHEERYEAKLRAGLLEEEAPPKTYHDKKEQQNQELAEGTIKLNEEATKVATGKTEGRSFGMKFKFGPKLAPHLH